jgi:hypothetical protein
MRICPCWIMRRRRGDNDEERRVTVEIVSHSVPAIRTTYSQDTVHFFCFGQIANHKSSSQSEHLARSSGFDRGKRSNNTGCQTNEIVSSYRRHGDDVGSCRYCRFLHSRLGLPHFHYQHPANEEKFDYF